MRFERSGITASSKQLSALAALSGAYDIAVGAALLLARPQLASWFGVPPPDPPIHADLNALFLVAVGVGYAWPFRDPFRHRGYLWVMGPFLKGAGALVFVLDYVLRSSPASYLLFAASDGALALITLVALMGRETAPSPHAAASTHTEAHRKV